MTKSMRSFSTTNFRTTSTMNFWKPTPSSVPKRARKRFLKKTICCSWGPAVATCTSSSPRKIAASSTSASPTTHPTALGVSPTSTRSQIMSPAATAAKRRTAMTVGLNCSTTRPLPWCHSTLKSPNSPTEATSQMQARFLCETALQIVLQQLYKHEKMTQDTVSSLEWDQI